MENKVQLNGIRLYAYHGVLPQERQAGNWFEVDLEVAADFTQAMRDDNLCHTIDYAGLFAVIKVEMQQPSNLLEHVAGRIITRLVGEYSSISSLRLKIAKQIPPLGSEIKESAVVIEGTAEEFKNILL